MISTQGNTKIQTTGGCSLYVTLTKQLKELGAEKGDKVYMAVEEINGKKRIIVEAVKKNELQNKR